MPLGDSLYCKVSFLYYTLEQLNPKWELQGNSPMFWTRYYKILYSLGISHYAVVFVPRFCELVNSLAEENAVNVVDAAVRSEGVLEVSCL